MKAGDQRWHEVFERDKGKCRYCGIDLLTTFQHYYFAEVDHLLPSSDSNRDELDNLILSCRACNGRLSQAHRLGLKTFEERKNYLNDLSVSKDTRAKYEQYYTRRKNGWG